MPRSTDDSIRKLIVQHRQEGKSVKEIAEIFKISTRTVINIYKRYEQTGSVSAEKSTGRPRLTTAEEDEHLREASKQNPLKSARVMKSELALPCSIHTVKRRLREENLRGRRAAKQHLLNARTMIDRVGFAYQYQQWNSLDWDTVVFSDEKIFHSDGTGDVWMHLPEENNGRFSVGAWGWMTAAGPGELVRIDGNLTATQYIDILENSLVPSLQMLFGEAVVYFVHDQSPIHTARITKDWLAEQEYMKVIDWPAMATDLNPIENLWADLTSDTLIGSTKDELWENICLKWEQLRQTDKCQVLVESMPKRLAQVIEKAGFWTKY